MDGENTAVFVVRKIVELLVILVKLPFFILGRIIGLFWWPEKDISKDIVLITGAASPTGLGAGMAREFAKQGCTLVLWDRDPVDTVLAELRKKYGDDKAFGYQVDVTNRQLVYETADKIRSEVGNVTILVNNAGIVHGKTLLESNDAMMEKVMNVNTISHFWTAKAFLPYMMEKDNGHIVTIASSAGLFGVSGLADYCASKFGAVGFDESIRFELRKQKKFGVHTTCVCPFFIDTGMFDGAQTEMPLFLPVLKPDSVVKRVVRAVRMNQTRVIIPRFLYLASIFQAFVPPALMDDLQEWFGTSKTMDDFKGRRQA